jgi:hypothetical protein
MLLYEKAMLAWLQGLSTGWGTNGVFFEEAETKQKEPFLVLQPISSSGARDAGVLHPIVQLDVYHADRYAAVELAERITSDLYLQRAFFDGIRIESVVAERMQAIKVEDGTWKIPIRIRFFCQED